MKRNIKLKGRLRNYMYWPMILTILLAVFNVPVYMINTKSGCVVTVFTVIYFIVVCLSYNYNKPVLVNELISFATQYGSAQKKLLEEFEIPYALLDHDGKILAQSELQRGNRKRQDLSQDHQRNLSGTDKRTDPERG